MTQSFVNHWVNNHISILCNSLHQVVVSLLFKNTPLPICQCSLLTFKPATVQSTSLCHHPLYTVFPGPHVVRKRHNERFDWKMKVTMACTIAAAVEIIIVLFMVLYWGQIRWLLRKFACPCVRMVTRSVYLLIVCYRYQGSKLNWLVW